MCTLLGRLTARTRLTFLLRESAPDDMATGLSVMIPVLGICVSACGTSTSTLRGEPDGALGSDGADRSAILGIDRIVRH